MGVMKFAEIQGMFGTVSAGNFPWAAKLYADTDGTFLLEALMSPRDALTHQFGIKPEELDLVGLSAKGKRITLRQCYVKSSDIPFGGIARVVFVVQIVFIGAHLPAPAEEKFDRALIWCGGFDVWFGHAKIETQFASDPDIVLIKYETPANKTYVLTDGTVVQILANHTTHNSDSPLRKEIEVKTEVEIKPSTALGFKEIQRLGNQFIQFFSLLTDKMAPIQALTLFQEGCGDAKGGQRAQGQIEVFYSQPSRHLSKPGSFDPSMTLVPFESIADKFEMYLDAWHSALNLEGIKSASDLYFGSRSSAVGYLDTKFLMLTQAVEVLHSILSPNQKLFTDERYVEFSGWLERNVPADFLEWAKNRLRHGNSPSQRQRFRELAEPLEQLGVSRDKLKSSINQIINVRNELTHGGALGDDADIDSLVTHVMLLEWIFRINLMVKCRFQLAEADLQARFRERIQNDLPSLVG